MKVLGEGSFAKVYKISNLKDDEKYAVKIFMKESFDDEENKKEHLINEINIL